MPEGCNWTPPALADLPSWAEAKRVAIDTETRDELLNELGPGVRRGGYIVGISFAIEDGPAAYLPIRHAGGGNLPVDQVLAYLRTQAATFKGELCGANLGYDLDFLTEEGVTFNPKFFRDIQVAEPLIDENQFRYSLEAIAAKYGFAGKNETILRDAADAFGLDPKKDLWKLHSKYAGVYAEQDAAAICPLLRRQERELDAQDLWGIYDLESRLLPVLVRMRRRGVKVDFEQLARVEEYSIQQEQVACDSIYQQSFVRIAVGEINQKTLVAKALDNLKIPYMMGKDGKPSLPKSFFKSLGNNPAAKAILDARRFNKMQQFCVSIRKYETHGRIHATFNQLRRDKDDGSGDLEGAGPGRLSCVDPNLQQAPSKKLGEVGKMFRAIFVPEDGCEWNCADWSGQEPRMAVHGAAISHCTGAQAAVDYYNNDPKADLHCLTTRLIAPRLRDKDKGDPEFDRVRDIAKVVYLGRLYGMGDAKLCHTLGYPTTTATIRGELREVAGEEGNKFLAEFNAAVPWIKQFAYKAKEAALAKGYIRTILGRRIHYVQGEGNERKAANNYVQGSSADQAKLALVMLDSAGIPLQLAVHDEADWSDNDGGRVKMAVEIMETCLPLRVPSKVDLESGPDWGYIK